MIDFIGARDGGIEFFAGTGNPVGFAKTPNMVAYIIKTHKLATSVFHSSSMDFADEYGFADYDGAWKLWETGMELV